MTKEHPVVLLYWARVAFAARPRNPATAASAMAALEAAVRAWHAAKGRPRDQEFYENEARFWAGELGFELATAPRGGDLLAIETGSGSYRAAYLLPPVILDRGYYFGQEI